MQIYIMRHGQASPMSSNDSQRELTEQGFLEASVMAKYLKNLALSFDRVFVSPYIRAQQTAHTVLENSEISAPLETLKFITPSGNAQEVHDYIDGICNVEKIERLLIVSHMPLVSYLVAQLTVEHESPIFQTAAIAQIDYDLQKMKGHLVKLTSPYDLV